MNDPTTKSVLWLIEKQGYAVTTTTTQMTATHQSKDTIIINGDDEYHNACEIAERIGIELEDG